MIDLQIFLGWKLQKCFFSFAVLEEMPPFPERESSLLAKLKKKKGGADKEDKEVEPPTPAAPAPATTQQPTPAAAKVTK